MAKNKDNQQQGKQTTETENKRESTPQNALAQTQTNQQTGLSRREGVPGLINNPFSLMRRFGEDMERIFDEFGLGRLPARGFDQLAGWSPQVEVLQRDGQLVIRADLPGINKDNVKVELRDDSVILRGERREEHKEEREGFFRTERSYGSFYREIPLPQDVDISKASATFNDGVLEITMPSSQGQVRGRELEIKDSQTEQQPKQMGQAAGAGR
jgi:HSP20 family protein